MDLFDQPIPPESIKRFLKACKTDGREIAELLLKSAEGNSRDLKPPEVSPAFLTRMKLRLKNILKSTNPGQGLEDLVHEIESCDTSNPS